MPTARQTQTDKQCDWGVSLQIKKINPEQRLVTGWVAIVSDENGAPIIDADDHMIPVLELEKAAYRAFAESGGAGKVGDLHERRGMCDVVESFVITMEKREALGFGKGPEGWVATFRVNDPVLWEQIKSGEKPELSLKGQGTGVWV